MLEVRGSHVNVDRLDVKCGAVQAGEFIMW